MTFLSPITAASPLTSPLGLMAPLMPMKASATVTVQRALELLPEAVRDATLEELSEPNWSAVRAVAARTLSPRMLFAFDEWADAARKFAAYDPNEMDKPEGRAVTERWTRTLKLVARTPADTHADADFKLYLHILQRDDDGQCYGPASFASVAEDDFIDHHLITGINADLLQRSELVRALENRSPVQWLNEHQFTTTVTKADGEQLRVLATNLDAAEVEPTTSDIHPLPPFPNGTSPDLVDLIDAYRGIAMSHDGSSADRWDIAARRIAKFRARSVSDACAKLMIGLHYLYPTVEQTTRFESKLAIEADMFECDSAGKILTTVMHELADLCSAEDEVKPGAGDEDVLGEVATYLQNRADLHLLPNNASDAECNPLFAAMDRSLDRLVRARATNLAGIAGKLTIAFEHLSTEAAWGDLAAIDPQAELFTSELAKAEPPVRLMWSAIEDIARAGKFALTGPLTGKRN